MYDYQRQFRTNISIYLLLGSILSLWIIYHPIFALASQIKICDKTMIATNPTITIEPQDPVQGGTYTISTAFSIDNLSPSSIINDGTEQLKVSLSGYPIVNENLPLCDNVPCPIGNGFHNFSWDGNVPTGVHGAVLVSEDWLMTNGSSILCFSVGYYI
jgi:hypothetical protein